MHPGVNRVAFSLMDEIVDAFEADAIHVGLDEVFLIGGDACPNTQGGWDSGVLFAKAVEDLHRHLTCEKGLTMLMWGDRTAGWRGNGIREMGSQHKRHGARHRLGSQRYRDVRLALRAARRLSIHTHFPREGLPGMAKQLRKLDAAEALMNCAEENASDLTIGHLCTTWTSSTALCKALLQEGDQSQLPESAVQVADVIQMSMKRLQEKH